MKDDITMLCYLSLAGCIQKMIYVGKGSDFLIYLNANNFYFYDMQISYLHY